MKHLFRFAALVLFVPFTLSLTAQTRQPGDGKKLAITDKAIPNLPLEFLAQDQKAFEVKFPIGDANWETAWRVEWDMENIAQARNAGMVFPKERGGDDLVIF